MVDIVKLALILAFSFSTSGISEESLAKNAFIVLYSAISSIININIY